MSLTRKERIGKGLLKTGEIAKEAGLLSSCVRYYTKLGLLDVHSKTQGKFSLYKLKETLERLRKIKDLKMQGRSLDIIREKVGKI
ncbi:MAG: MerR family transcriptional regulator [Candidatus Omnitrophota bacterium]